MQRYGATLGKPPAYKLDQCSPACALTLGWLLTDWIAGFQQEVLRLTEDRDPNLLALDRDVRALRDEMRVLNGHRFIRLHNSMVKLLAFNFARGLAFGLGTVIGASVLISMVAWSISQIEFLPIIGEWAAEIARQMKEAAESQ